MGWRMKNINIFRVHGKIRVLGGGGVTKKTIHREDCLRGELGLFADLRARKRGWCFWGGIDTPMHTMFRVCPVVLPTFCHSVREFSWDCFIGFIWNSAWCSRSMICSAWQSQIFLKKFFLSQTWEKWAKNRVFWIYWKI